MCNCENIEDEVDSITLKQVGSKSELCLHKQGDDYFLIHWYIVEGCGMCSINLKINFCPLCGRKLSE